MGRHDEHHQHTQSSSSGHNRLQPKSSHHRGNQRDLCQNLHTYRCIGDANSTVYTQPHPFLHMQTQIPLENPVFEQANLGQSTYNQNASLNSHHHQTNHPFHTNVNAPYTPFLPHQGISSIWPPRVQDTTLNPPNSIDPLQSDNLLQKLQLPSDQITDKGIIPNTPYYDLPAGLMVPVVPPTRLEYRPLDPAELRLPLPKFPDESFLRTIDNYYGDDSKNRDNDGWDRTFINAYIGQKVAQAGS